MFRRRGSFRHRREAHALDALGELGERQPHCGLRGRGDARYRPLRDQYVANRVAHEIVNQGTVAEAHLGFRGVHIHIHFLEIAIEKQQREGIAGLRHQVVIGGRDRVQQQAVANESPVDKQIDGITIQLLNLRPTDKAAQTEMAGSRFVLLGGQRDGARLVPQVQEILQHLASEDLEHAFAERPDGADVEQFRVVMAQQKALIGMRQAVVRDQRRDVGDLGLLGPQKFLARGHVIKQIAHRDGGASGERAVVATQDLASGDFDRRSRRFLAGSRFKQQARHRGNRGQGFAAKPERRDRKKILHIG